MSFLTFIEVSHGKEKAYILESKKKKHTIVFTDICKIQRNLQKSLRTKFGKVKENKFT